MYKKYKESMASGDTAVKMEYNFLSETCGLQVSNLCLGTMTFGESTLGIFPGQADEAAAHALLDRFEAAGGNFLDTANVYSHGASERIVGSWMKKKQNRDNIVVATKARYNSEVEQENYELFKNPKHPNRVGLSRKNIIKSVEDSLERLQTDYIDLYQTHGWDDATPIKETLLTLNDLVRAGKVRYVGGCNLTGWQLQKILDLNQSMGFDQWVTLQQQYSLMYRGSEAEPFEVCRREGLGILPWSPLASGLLTDKVRASRGGNLPEGSRLEAISKSIFNKFLGMDKMLAANDTWTLLDTANTIAEEHKKTIAQVALRWLLQRPSVTSVLIGAKTMEQLESNLGASSGWQLTEEQMNKLNEVSAPAVAYPYDIIHTVNLGRERRLVRQF